MSCLEVLLYVLPCQRRLRDAKRSACLTCLDAKNAVVTGGTDQPKHGGARTEGSAADQRQRQSAPEAGPALARTSDELSCPPPFFRERERDCATGAGAGVACMMWHLAS